MKKNVLIGIISGLISLGIVLAILVFVAPIGRNISKSGQISGGDSTGSVVIANTGKTYEGNGQKATPSGGTMKADVKKKAASKSDSVTSSKSSSKSGSTVSSKTSSKSKSAVSQKSSSKQESGTASASSSKKEAGTVPKASSKSTDKKESGSTQGAGKSNTSATSEKESSDNAASKSDTGGDTKQDTDTVLLSYADNQDYVYGMEYAVTWNGSDYDRSAISTTNLGYCIKDFDKDGQNELLILDIDNDYSITARVYEEKDGKVKETSSLQIVYPQTEDNADENPKVAGLYNGSLEIFVFEHNGIKIALDNYTQAEDENNNLRKLALLAYSEGRLSLEKVIYLGESREGWGTEDEPFEYDDSTADNHGREQFRKALEEYGAEDVPEGDGYISPGTSFITFFPSASALAQQDFRESEDIAQLKSGDEAGMVSFAARDELYSGENSTSSAKDSSYCRDLNAQFDGFTLADSDGKPVDQGDYYELPVTVYTSGDVIAEKELGKTTVRISKDARVLYMGYDEDGNRYTRLISLDEYAQKICGASSYSDCTYTRIWSNVDDPGSESDQEYKVYYNEDGYITQFYDGEFN